MDIDPSNVVVNRNGWMYVSCHGVAMLVLPFQHLFFRFNDFSKDMAPELMDSNLPRVSGTNRLDIWSMGICCWTALSFKVLYYDQQCYGSLS